jgi:reductive dehalogenase
METNDSPRYSRRDFGKILAGVLGMGAATMAGPLAKMVQAEEETQKRREKLRLVDGSPIQIDQEKIERFSSKDIAFNVISRQLGKSWFDVGYRQNLGRNLKEGRTSQILEPIGKAQARSAAALTLAATGWNMLNGAHGEGHENTGPLSWSPYKMPLFLANWPPYEKDPEILTQQVKLVARLFGADLVNVGPFNPAWIYSSTQVNPYDPGQPKMKDIVIRDVPKPQGTDHELVIPSDARSVVVMAYEINRLMVQTSPSFLSSAATNLAYGRMGVGSIFLAEFIRGLGYWAIPAKNDTGLSVPMGIEAGLGEFGRNGLLITPEYGPNNRLSKVITNMPLVLDKPISFGVAKFCEICKKCARECPSGAITEGEQTWEGPTECNIKGVKKWYNNTKECLHFWLENGTSCANCLAVCPFTKGASWGHHVVKWMIENVSASDDIWLALDDGFGYGKHRTEKEIWQADITCYGIDPEKR